MPHVIVKLWPGKSEQQKTRLAQTLGSMTSAHLGKGDALEFCFDGPRVMLRSSHQKLS